MNIWLPSISSWHFITGQTGCWLIVTLLVQNGFLRNMLVILSMRKAENNLKRGKIETMQGKI